MILHLFRGLKLPARLFVGWCFWSQALIVSAAPTDLYRDPTAPVEQRVQDLLSRMTLEEKVAQLRCLWFGKSKLVDNAGNFSQEKASNTIQKWHWSNGATFGQGRHLAHA
jgi:hypothetical protein